MIDDSLLVLETVKTLLEEEPCQLLISDSVVKALFLVARHQPQCIFIDAGMPKLSGFHFCALLMANLCYQAVRIVSAATGKFTFTSQGFVSLCRRGDYQALWKSRIKVIYKALRRTGSMSLLGEAQKFVHGQIAYCLEMVEQSLCEFCQCKHAQERLKILKRGQKNIDQACQLESFINEGKQGGSSISLKNICALLAKQDPAQEKEACLQVLTRFYQVAEKYKGVPVCKTLRLK